MTDHFTYRVSWSEEDGEHVGTCLEFPSLSHLADDPEAALRGIRKLVADVAADLRANNEPIPQPLADSRYSGKFMTRIPPELHRQLAFEAAQEQISLNRLVSLRLSAQPSLRGLNRAPLPDGATQRSPSPGFYREPNKRKARRFAKPLPGHQSAPATARVSQGRHDTHRRNPGDGSAMLRLRGLQWQCRPAQALLIPDQYKNESAVACSAILQALLRFRG